MCQSCKSFTALIHGKFKSEAIYFSYIKINSHPPGEKRDIFCDLKQQKISVSFADGISTSDGFAYTNNGVKD